MACSSCGKRRKIISGPTKRTPVKPDSIKSVSYPKMKNIKSLKGVEIIKDRTSNIIKELVNTNRQVILLDPSIKGRFIYLVGYKSNCSECQYLKNILEREGRKYTNPEIWEMNPKNVSLKGLPFKSTPMVYFVENGSLISYYSGFEKKIVEDINTFLSGKDITKEKEESKPIIEKKTKKVFILEPKPTITDSYEEFMSKLDDTNVDRISTFVDPNTNNLVVTVIYNTP